MGTSKIRYGLHCLVLAANLLPFAASAQQRISPVHGRGFVSNVGQVLDQHHLPHPEVRYLWAGGTGMNVQVRDNGLSYDTYTAETKDGPVHFHRLDMYVLNGSANARLIGEAPRPDRINIHGFNAVPHFDRLRYNSIYPGIDMALSQSGANGAFKYDLVLHPGADVNAVQLRFEGYDSAVVNEKSMDFFLSGKHLTESIPHSWTLPGGKPADVLYRVVEQDAEHVVVGLEWADATDHGPDRTLVVDPDPVIEWATYYGDTAYDSGRAIAVHQVTGRVYVAGATRSIANIATEGTYESTFLGDMDVFVACFMPLGSLPWVTYYGGENWDVPTGIAVDSLKNIYLIGNTASTLGISTVGAQQEELAGDTDVFVAKFDSLGHRLWGSYIGGLLNDSAATFVLDGKGGFFLAGTSASTEFLGDSVPPLHPPSGGKDAFRTQIGSTGHRTWTTFFGGAADDIGNGLAMDSTGIWLAGTTASTAGIASDSVHQDSLAGMKDAFLVRMDSSGNVQWATYFGGADNDGAISVAAVGKSAFITGETFSDSLVTDTAAHQWRYGGGGDVFIARIDSGGALAWATYLGDSSEDRSARIIRDPGGQVRVIGTTASDSTIATAGVPLEELQGATDVFITKFDTTGHRLWGAYFGGPGADEGTDIAVFDVNIMFFTGTTSSGSGIFDMGVREALSGTTDAFIARFQQHNWNSGDSTAVCDTCVCNGSGPGGGGGWPDSLHIDGPDTIFACTGDTVRITFNIDSFPDGYEPVWYDTHCGDPRYFLYVGDTLAFVPEHSMFVELRAENVFGPSSCQEKFILIEDRPIPLFSIPSGACLGDTVQGYAYGADHYSWNGPGDFTSDEQEPSIIPPFAGDSLVYHVTAFSQHGCSSSDSLIVQVLPPPNIDITITGASCYGEADGSIELIPLDTVPLNFLWPTTGSNEASRSGLAAGQYVVVTSNAQCSRTDSLVVPQPTYPIDSLETHYSTCGNANGWAMLVVNQASPPYQFLWSNGDTVAFADPLLAGSYQVKLTDALGCVYTEQGTVIDLGSMALSVFPDTALVNIVDSIQLEAELVPLDSTTDFHWSPPEALSCTECLTPYASPQSDTWFVFTATSAYGCMVADSVLLNTWYTCPEIFVPTIFSPNNDGLNDDLCVLGGCIAEFQFTITDRWGETVFQTDDPARCWDGNLRGRSLNGGPFRYMLHVVKDDGTVLERAGEILIRR
ncbi:MAG: gliding motility-associated C-terminal domain-containing protein [Flavobacteriales bacterium]|nr:gliding motility-associated C-terminal domain-containing protein [Flavobacteriales bacterium]